MQKKADSDKLYAVSKRLDLYATLEYAYKIEKDVHTRATRDEQESIKFDLQQKFERLKQKSDTQVSQTELARLLLETKQEFDDKLELYQTIEEFQSMASAIKATANETTEKVNELGEVVSETKLLTRQTQDNLDLKANQTDFEQLLFKASRYADRDQMI